MVFLYRSIMTARLLPLWMIYESIYFPTISCDGKNSREYIPWNMHVVLLSFILLGLHSRFYQIHLIHLPIFFRVTSLALGQSYDFPSASDVTLKDMGKTNLY